MINAIEYEFATEEGVSVLDKNQSLFVGDRNEDKECADNAGIPFEWAVSWLAKYGG